MKIWKQTFKKKIKEKASRINLLTEILFKECIENALELQFILNVLSWSDGFVSFHFLFI